MLSAPTELRYRIPSTAASVLLLGFTSSFRPLPPVAPPPAADVVAIQWAEVPTAIYAGQTFELSVDVLVGEGVELLQLFPQPLDVPLQVEAFGRIDRIGLAPPPAVPERSESAALAAARGSVVVDGDVVTATGPFSLVGDPEGARRYRVTRQARVYRAGLIELPAPTARYATATAFREDLVRGRVPVDRSEQTARGSAASFEVLSLPRAGCPVTFDGAVGTFRLSNTVEPRAARMGDSVRLTVLVEGATPLHGVPAPHVDAGDDVDVLGTSRRDVSGGTAFAFDLAFRSTEVIETPTVTLTAFDPHADPPAYLIHRVTPLPIAIRPAPVGAETIQARAGDQDAGGVADGAPSSDAGADPSRGGVTEEPDHPKLIWTPIVLGVILSLAFLARVRHRRTRSTPPS